MFKQTSYLLIGDGRLAKHLIFYFNQLNLKFETWSRKNNVKRDLDSKVKKADRILLLINDSSIEVFAKENLKEFLEKPNKNKLLIHCSGALVVEGIIGVHPLQSFAKNTLYSLEEYEKICFFYEKNNSNLGFNDIFPELANPNYAIDIDKKALYHALGVGANNFTTILWQSFAKRMHSEFDVDFETIKYFMTTTAKNIENNIDTALTGPLIRKDESTIRNNIDSLRKDNFKNLYQAFLDFYNLESKVKK